MVLPVAISPLSCSDLSCRISCMEDVWTLSLTNAQHYLSRRANGNNGVELMSVVAAEWKHHDHAQLAHGKSLYGCHGNESNHYQSSDGKSLSKSCQLQISVASREKRTQPCCYTPATMLQMVPSTVVIHLPDTDVLSLVSSANSVTTLVHHSERCWTSGSQCSSVLHTL